VRLTDRIHVVASGVLGLGLTEPGDCHVYLIDGGDELALVDSGCGGSADSIVARIRTAGLEPERVRHILLTHAHADHAGGAARLRARLGSEPRVWGSALTADLVSRGDEAGISLDVARAAGVYPVDYRFEACPVEGELREDAALRIGDLTVETIDAPGHADGQVCLLVEGAGRRDLLSADAVYHGGKVMLLPTRDCRLDGVVSTLRRLRPLAFDGLLPGHGEFDTEHGPSHVERANKVLDALLFPENMIPAEAVDADA
jgi:hydroxyacylglutathione hydrolase